MRPLVVGAGGQLGQALSALFRARGFELAAYAHGELEIADADAVRRAIERHHASHVFNAAAYNAVDRAEVEARQAFAVNALGPMNLALAACEQGAILMHYSTDYVFDGAKQEAYVEDDPPSPLSVYARSKLLGEQAVIAVSPAAYVVRTAWVFAPGGNNFISRLLAAADSGRRLAYVDDVCSSPTYAEDLAQASLVLCQQAPAPGIYHAAGAAAETPYQWARAVLAHARPGIEVAASSSGGVHGQARRPRRSVLGCGKLAALGITIPAGRTRLAAYFEAEGAGRRQ